MNRLVKSRLARYETVDQCGKWYCHLIDDFNSDARFIRTSEDMYEAALLPVLKEVPVSDGWSIAGIDIEIGRLLTIRFQLCFLNPDYFYTPAEFNLELSPDNPNRGIGTYPLWHR